MTQQDLRALLQRYALRRGEDPSAPAGYQFFAYYAELPGCVAQADSPGAAIAELDTLMRVYLDSVLGGKGSLPVPFADRGCTQRLRIGPIFVGDFSEYAGAAHAAFETSETQLEAPSSIQRREMETVALN
jgi:predicted RNase H-like HicB family nuclease